MKQSVLVFGIPLIAATGLIILVWFIRASAGAAAFPCKPGFYEKGEWRYEYSINAPGTRSEQRVGRLFERNRPIAGSIGEIRETPLGRFAYFGSQAQGYNTGWLNTLTYGEPVFGSDGQVLPEVLGYLGKPGG